MAEKNHCLEFSMVLYCFNLVNTRSVSWNTAYVCMCPSLAPEPLDVFCSYLVLKSLCVIGRFLVNINILSPKIEPTPQRGSRKQNGNFLFVNDYNDFDYI
jgi:hypothetical protein